MLLLVPGRTITLGPVGALAQPASTTAATRSAGLPFMTLGPETLLEPCRRLAHHSPKASGLQPPLDLVEMLAAMIGARQRDRRAGRRIAVHQLVRQRLHLAIRRLRDGHRELRGPPRWQRQEHRLGGIVDP